jgi:hypothetical protein
MKENKTMKNTTKLNVKEMAPEKNRALAADELTCVAGGYDGAYADEEAEAFSHSPYADNGEVAPSAAPAAPSSQKRRVRRFMEVTVNGKKRLVGYWDFV